ncbi:tetratricopeptide repeat protein [Pelotalea chapellei]|uniref:Tetratricopeptide repeat protein n=1 Tax=Pelotalea chapellei TaxID=44671 RepID=A0ABS5U7A2_9BACT|nr:hypothetical protein [Pelotalea chapellei]
MKFLSRLFSKNTEDYLAKGANLLAAERFFDARTTLEEGLRRHLENDAHGANDEVAIEFAAKIALANRELSSLNICEAEGAIRQGLLKKALEHLELAKTLTNDTVLREKADKLLESVTENAGTEKVNHVPSGGCGSCSSKGHEASSDAVLEEPDMDLLDYYDLLIRQLPAEMYKRYKGLGEEFAYFYIASSRDEHDKALALLDEWYKKDFSDIYQYEKGKVLYRIGKVEQAETCFLDAIRLEEANSLAHLGLALLYMDAGRLDEAAVRLDQMIARTMIPEQTHLLRGEVCMMAGDAAGAMDIFAGLLQSPVAKPAAERLHHILLESGRHQEAALVFKKYLGGCCH